MTTPTYEVRTLKDRRWTSAYSSPDRHEALHQAHELVASGHFQEVRVVQEIFNTALNAFRERVIFKYREPDPSAPGMTPVAPAAGTTDSPRRSSGRAAASRRRSLWSFLRS